MADFLHADDENVGARVYELTVMDAVDKITINRDEACAPNGIIAKEDVPKSRNYIEKIASTTENGMSFFINGQLWRVYTETLERDGENIIRLMSSRKAGSIDDAARKKFFDLVQRAALKFNPLYATAGYDGSYRDGFLYFSDPYRFATPTPREWDLLIQLPVTKAGYRKVFNLPVVLAELNEARQALTLHELKELITKNCLEAAHEGKGIGIWTSKPYGSESSANNGRGADFLSYVLEWAFPTYFIREELRKRGAKLFFGPTEILLLEALSVWPEYLGEAGIIKNEMANKLLKLEKHNEGLPDDEKERKVFETLTQEEIHELGLDLPKPPVEMLKGE